MINASLTSGNGDGDKMSQSVVTIRLNGTPYQIGCGAGEEDHVTRLGAEVEDVLQSLVEAVGQIGEARLLAMATLILADRASDAGTQKRGLMWQ